jgi:UDP-GlcNAc3NAcA epimerase
VKVLTAVGARPQFIKAAPVSEALRLAGVDEVIVHSGQHYDDNMSRVFFEELGIPEPALNLGIGSGSHGAQTGHMLAGFEQAIEHYRPDFVLVHGDTNSTLAAALAAVKLQVKVAHNEAGLRSFNRSMPEEHNRVLTDHCADLLFCPTQHAVEQLQREGVTRGVHRVGDVMYDACLHFGSRAATHSGALARLGLEQGGYYLATLHRPYNVDDPRRLAAILDGLARAPAPVVLPQHPRLVQKLAQHGLSASGSLRLIEPVGYLDMTSLERSARMIVTDSGGVQKEAYFHGVPCLTVRPETEWLETVEAGWNRLSDADAGAIRHALTERWWPEQRPELFGDGHAAQHLVRVLRQGA